MYLAGDIGGSKTLLGIYADATGPRQPVREIRLMTADHPTPAALVSEVGPVDSATLAIAGAVIEGHARGSNLPWEVWASEMSAALGGAPVQLVNDLQAIAAFVPLLQGSEVATLNAMPAYPAGPIGVIAPGTGLGQAMLISVDGRYQALPSEAGHVDFAPTTPLQDEYLGYLRERFERVSLERACSGGSFRSLFEFLTASGFPSHPDVEAEVRDLDDPTPSIIEAAILGRCTTCMLALDLFVEMLGAAAGNLALQIVATGGIYLGGGIPPRILPVLQQPRFLEAFTNKGRFRELAESIPVHVILEPRAGLFGAAYLELDRSGDR